MDKVKWNILLVDDEEDDFLLTRDLLAEALEHSFSLVWAATYPAGREAILSGAYDAILMDYSLGAKTGIDLAREVIAAGCDVPILLLTGHGSYDVDMEAMQAGVSDYLNKNRINPSSLERAIRYAVERQRSRKDLEAAQAELAAANHILAARNTELEEANAAMRLSEERFRLAASVMNDCAWDWDVAAQRIWRSESYYTLFGPFYEPVDSTLDWWSDRLHPADRERVQASFQQAFDSSATRWDEEYRFRRGDGSYAVVHDSAYLVRSQQGQVLRVAGGVQDITGQKETAARYRQILETSYEGIWSMDVHGLTDFINERGASILGYAAEEMIGRKPVEFLFTEDAELLHLSIDTQTPDFREYRVRSKSGAEVWISSSTTPIFADDGSYSGALAVFTDISSRKKTEFALLESQKRFQVALSSVPMVVFTTDRDLRYTWIYNPYNSMGLEDALGRTDADLFALDDVAELADLKKQVQTSGRGVQKELQICINGESQYYAVNIEPMLDEEGQVTGLTAAALDVTRQRKLELQHRESITQMEVRRHLAEHREQERQEIARNIHDGPLQGLIALIYNLQYIQEELTEPRSAEAIEQAGVELKTMVRELREVCNELRPPALLRFGLSRAIRIHAADFQERHAVPQVELDLFEDGNLLPEHVCLSLYRIYQECLNNIIRHSEASQAWVRFACLDQQVILEVRDNGKGLPAATDWVELARGNHFGLAGIKERTDAISGTLSLHSLPGQGTTVQITLHLQPDCE
jgi:PAS domain S-box-containing protein